MARKQSSKRADTAALKAQKEASNATEIIQQFGLSVSMQDGSNRYAMYDELGHGGVGLVYFGMDKALHRQVAVKILRKRYLKDKAAVAHFLNEAKIMARLDHPGIVPVYDIGFMGNGELFFAMERVEGKTLRQILDERKSSKDVQRTLHDLVAIFEKVCQTVAYAHSRGIVHRDLKPENIMVGDYDSVYVMDWGIARDLTEQKRRRALHEVNGSTMDITTLLDARKVKGTPKYMSPEQAVGMSNVDLRSDVFSLGLIFYEILTGRHPFEADSLRDTMHRIKQAPLPKMRSYFIPNELKSICRKTLQKLPAERYQHAGELAEDVHCSLSYQDVSAHHDNPLMWVWKFTRRHVVFTLASVFAITVAGILGTTYFSGLRYSTKLLEMAEARIRSANECDRVIGEWQLVKGIDEADRKRKIAKLRARQHMSLVGARALFCAALKKHGHELSRKDIESLKQTWFAELTYHMQLDNIKGARDAFEEMAEDGFLKADNPIMLWTPEEIERIKGYDQYLNPPKVTQR